MAGKAGLEIVSISSLQSDRFLFAKFRGSMQACHHLLNELGQESIVKEIDKIIISVLAANDYSFALHFQL